MSFYTQKATNIGKSLFDAYLHIIPGLLLITDHLSGAFLPNLTRTIPVNDIRKDVDCQQMRLRVLQIRRS